MYDMQSQSGVEPKLVITFREGITPAPRRRDKNSKDAAYVHTGPSEDGASGAPPMRLARKRARSQPTPRKQTARYRSDSTELAPRSQSADELGQPEADRPPSWYPCGDSIGSQPPRLKARRPDTPEADAFRPHGLWTWGRKRIIILLYRLDMRSIPMLRLHPSLLVVFDG